MMPASRVSLKSLASLTIQDDQMHGQWLIVLGHCTSYYLEETVFHLLIAVGLHFLSDLSVCSLVAPIPNHVLCPR